MVLTERVTPGAVFFSRSSERCVVNTTVIASTAVYCWSFLQLQEPASDQHYFMYNGIQKILQGTSVEVAVGLGVTDGVYVAVDVDVLVAVGDGELVTVGVSVEVLVAVGVCVGVAGKP